MPLAVRFDEYGDIDVLKVVDVPRPVPGRGQVLVAVKAAGINPGEASIRKGLLHSLWPATFPSGEGSDLAGVITELGPGVTGVAVGDEVLGFVDTRSSQAELVVADVDHLVPRPPRLPWDVAGSLFVVGRPPTPPSGRWSWWRATPWWCRGRPEGWARSPSSWPARPAPP